ncbi:hypothetical protein J132_01266 [Termitomyces sp. J132]|nr:hypothetical protein J132_01266 [Termitomyces sp. J132]
MAPNHLIPTMPHKNPVGPAAKLPCALPITHPSSGQDSPDNFALQVYKLISVHLARLDKTLGPSDVECTGDLLNDLQVLPEVFLPF